MNSLTNLIGLAILGTWLIALPAYASGLRVRLLGIENDQGTVRVALFANEQAFKSSAPRIQKKVPAHIDEVWLTFENIPPGRYGISAFHDVNGNEKLDTSFLGLPKEPYGFSQNARGRFGPPNFSDISFEVDSSPKTLDINLR